MNKYAFLIFFMVTGIAAQAQCLTSSLVINTGYNSISGTAIAGGANGATAVPDPHWLLVAMSPATSAAIAATPLAGLTAVAPGANADVVTPVGGAWIANPGGNPGNWISGMNSNTYNDQGTNLLYTMTFGRPFRMCTADNIILNLYVSSDNSISSANIDGTIPLTLTGTGYNAYTFFTQTIALSPGTHTINIVVNNQNLTTLGSNPTGLNVYGTVSSATSSNSLVSESYVSCSTYTCGSNCNTLSLPDTLHLCQGGSDTLRAAVMGTDSVISIAWTPVTGLSSSTVLRPLLTAGTTSGWYDLTIQSVMPYNLVYNGDFSLGNTGFSSSYIYSPPPSTILNEGYYSVYNNPNGVHTGFLSMGPPTGSSGNMLIINGGGAPTAVWCETIPVTPNTNYDFSAWFADCSSVTVGAFVPILQFMVNGILLGTPTSVTAPPGTWVNFFSTWNSGANTSATLCVYDELTATNGNDFVIDDISFKQICTTEDSIYVDVNLIDTTYSHVNDSTCINTAIVLTAPSGYSSYLWSNGNNTSSITVTAAGDYWVYAPPHNCAMSIDTFHVFIKPAPPMPVVRDTFYCLGFGGALPLIAQVDSVPGTLNWYLNGATVNAALPPPTNTVTYPAGTVWGISQTVDGCEGDTAHLTIYIVSPPDITITPSSPWVCQFDSITLSYTGPGLINGGFLWSLPPGASLVGGSALIDSSIFVKFDSTTGNIVHLTANNLYGECPNTDSITLQVIKLPTASAFSKADVCLNDTVTLSLSSRSASAISFAWYIDNSLLFSSNAVTVVAANANSGGPYSIQWSDTGTHIIHVQPFAEHGCTNTPAADTVNVHPLPDATFNITTSSGSLCLEDSVWFSANENNYQDNYNWAPPHFFNNDNTDKPAVWGKADLAQSIITLTVTDPFGCTASASRELDPSDCCNVVFPNAFTPNGDAHNNVFRPVPVAGYHRYHIFRIQNRWGQTVFESTDNKAVWDGTFNGVPQDMGVYYYYLKYDCGNKTLEQKGDVTLIR